MNSNEHWIVGSALLGLSLVLGMAATAMELHNGSALAQSSTAPPLPTFLNGTRLSGMRENLTPNSGEPAGERRPIDPGPTKKRTLGATDTYSAPNNASPHAGSEGRSARSVRQRAEELSARFGGSAPAATTSEGRASKITTDALPDKSPSRLSSQQGKRATNITPLAPEKQAAVADAQVAPAPRKVTRAVIPPNPVRSPRAAKYRKPNWPPKSRVGATLRANERSQAPPPEKRKSPPLTVPNELRSHGWDAEVERH